MPEDRVSFKFELGLCGRTIEAETSIPNAPLRVADLLPVLHSFDDAVVAMAADKVESEGRKLSCRDGCGACCRQVVPISQAEAYYLAELVAAMPPERQARVRGRFRDALAALGEPMAARLRDTAKLRDLESRRELGKEYFRLGVACPFLEDESCSIYPYRPMSCREYLVTSPAQNCSHPAPESIEPVPLPLKLSEILYCFKQDTTSWVPLVIALEWVEQQAGSPPRYSPGPELFKDFLNRIGDKR